MSSLLLHPPPSWHRTNQVTDSNYFVSSPTWSPDSTRIAFTSRGRGFDSEIYVVGDEGRYVRQVTDDLSSVAAMTWSMDGSEILFANARGR